MDRLRKRKFRTIGKIKSIEKDKEILRPIIDSAAMNAERESVDILKKCGLYTDKKRKVEEHIVRYEQCIENLANLKFAGTIVQIVEAFMCKDKIEESDFVKFAASLIDRHCLFLCEVDEEYLNSDEQDKHLEKKFNQRKYNKEDFNKYGQLDGRALTEYHKNTNELYGKRNAKYFYEAYWLFKLIRLLRDDNLKKSKEKEIIERIQVKNDPSQETTSQELNTEDSEVKIEKPSRIINTEKLGYYFSHTFKGGGNSGLKSFDWLVEDLKSDRRSAKKFAQIALMCYEGGKMNSNRPATFKAWYEIFCECVGCEMKSYDRNKLTNPSTALQDQFSYLR